MVFELLIKRQVIELSAKSKLLINLFLTNAEVLEVEEANVLRCVL